jgi:hypothetical protein
VIPYPDGFLIGTPAVNPPPPFPISIYGAPMPNLIDMGVGFIPFVPLENSGRFYRFSLDLDASANSTVPGSILPKINLQFATFDIPQYFTTETDIVPWRLPGFSDPYGPNPAMDDAGEQCAAYLHLPEGTTLGQLETGSQLGEMIASIIRLQDDSDVLGGSIFVSNLQIHSFPEDLLP